MYEIGEGLAAAGWAVTAVDLPGHGSSAATGSYLFADVADALALQLGTGFDLYVGHSLGGAIGTVLMARHPLTAHRAVLIDPALRVTAEQVAGIPTELVADKELSVDDVAAQNPRWHRRTVRARMRATVAADVDAVSGYLRHNPAWDVTAEAAHVAVPVLVLVATQGSAVAPELPTELPAANAHWRFETIPNSTHSLHRDHPEVVLQHCLTGVTPSWRHRQARPEAT